MKLREQAEKRPPLIGVEPPMKRYALSERQIRVQQLSTKSRIKAGGYTCWYPNREGTEACCANHENAGDVEEMHGSYTCYVDVGTWDTD